ncbi:uncharacterized protein [Drosophila pseudoobscura]|uniref:Uncharacterized protein n=1 Tax=Drosophila pseudoobscura pseudoobscura TaxID=46245 RepID=A0A6I8V5J7_DROPS|nr:uncharacterized protein LOC6897153 [Drosophila pseudoobscura]
MFARVPLVDMWNVSKSCQKLRKETTLGFAAMNKKLSIINDQDVHRLDSFYLECQKYRDYYRDPQNKVIRPKIFTSMGRRGVKNDLSNMPITWVQDDCRPQMFPIEYGTDLSLGKGFQTVERNSRFTDTSFVR